MGVLMKYMKNLVLVTVLALSTTGFVTAMDIAGLNHEANSLSLQEIVNKIQNAELSLEENGDRFHHDEYENYIHNLYTKAVTIVTEMLQKTVINCEYDSSALEQALDLYIQNINFYSLNESGFNDINTFIEANKKRVRKLIQMNEQDKQTKQVVQLLISCAIPMVIGIGISHLNSPTK